MKLPKFIAGTPPPREAGIARAQDIGALTRTGGAEFEALTQLGGAIQKTASLGFQAYMHRQELDDIIESGVATQRVQESWNKVETEVDNFNPIHDMPLTDDPNYLKTLTTFGVVERDKFLEDKLRDVEKDATAIYSGIRNPKTKARLIKQYNENYTTWVKNLKGETDKKLDNYQLDEMSKLAKAAALNGNMEASDYYVDMMAKHGLILNTQATKWKTAYGKLSAETAIIDLYVEGSNLYKAGKIKEAGVLFEQARALTEATPVSILTSEEKVAISRNINTAERSGQVKAKAELKAQQDETAKTLLLSLWDGTLTDDSLREATESGMLTFERAKGFREALTNPKTFDLSSYIQVKNAVNSYESGKVSFDDALDILTEHASLLGDEGKGLTDKLFAMPNKNEADWEKEALNYIESQILEKDIFGRMYGTPEEQTAAMEARLAYDVTLEEAVRDGEPIEGRDKLIKAHEIMLKYRPEDKERKPPVELEKGLGAVPFINPTEVRKAIQQAKQNLGEKASPQDIKAETLRLLRE